MATITQGTGSFFYSTTLENFLVELCQYICILENDSTKNPELIENISGNFDQNTGVFSADFSIPVTQSIGATGAPQYVATNWLIGLPAITAIDGAFKSPTLASLLMEVIIKGQILEKTNNPNNRNYIKGRIDTDALVFTGTLELPVTMGLGADGEATFTAKTYLT